MDSRELDRAFGRGAFFILVAFTLFAVVELLEALIVLGATLTVMGDGRFEQLFRVQVAATGGGLFLQIWLLLWAVRRPALPTRVPSWTTPILLIIASALAGALTYGARAAAMMVAVRGIESTEAYGQYMMNVQILHIIGSAALGILVAVALALAFHRWRRDHSSRVTGSESDAP